MIYFGAQAIDSTVAVATSLFVWDDDDMQLLSNQHASAVYCLLGTVVHECVFFFFVCCACSTCACVANCLQQFIYLAFCIGEKIWYI